MKTNKTLFLDLDGVFANFEQHYFNMFGHTHNSVPDWKMWKNINSNDSWWTTILKFEHFDDMWDNLKMFNPIILTGCPKSNYEEAVIGKKQWVKKHFGQDVDVITCLSKDKQKYMKNPGDILIDDMEKNCTNWRNAGGYAIQFYPEIWSQVVEEVNSLMK
ncbi:MAG: 5'(3')-deoxyribonucleotidase [Caudoviricetes sp.]|nr:MAG: 5'(3')-deoxyribonucleotidase [Caudoviricetes sp.]